MDKNYINRSFRFLIYSFIFMTISFIIMYFINIDITLNDIFESPIKPDSTKLYKFKQYIINNGINIPFKMLILSVIPIPFLYFLNFELSAIMGGILFGFSIKILPFKIFIVLFLSSFPHMFVELLAFAFFASTLWDFNLWIRNKILKRGVSTNFSFELKRCIFRYLKYTLPLIVLGAFLETFIADVIFNYFSH